MLHACIPCPKVKFSFVVGSEKYLASDHYNCRAETSRMVEQGTCTAREKLSLTMENNQSLGSSTG